MSEDETETTRESEVSRGQPTPSVEDGRSLVAETTEKEGQSTVAVRKDPVDIGDVDGHMLDSDPVGVHPQVDVPAVEVDEVPTVDVPAAGVVDVISLSSDEEETAAAESLPIIELHRVTAGNTPDMNESVREIPQVTRHSPNVLYLAQNTRPRQVEEVLLSSDDDNVAVTEERHRGDTTIKLDSDNDNSYAELVRTRDRSDSDNSYAAMIDNNDDGEEDDIAIVSDADQTIPPAPTDLEMAGPSSGGAEAPLFVIGQPRTVRRPSRRKESESDEDVRIVPSRGSRTTIDID